MNFRDPSGLATIDSFYGFDDFDSIAPLAWDEPFFIMDGGFDLGGLQSLGGLFGDGLNFVVDAVANVAAGFKTFGDGEMFGNAGNLLSITLPNVAPIAGGINDSFSDSFSSATPLFSGYSSLGSLSQSQGLPNKWEVREADRRRRFEEAEKVMSPYLLIDIRELSSQERDAIKRQKDILEQYVRGNDLVSVTRYSQDDYHWITKLLVADVDPSYTIRYADGLKVHYLSGDPATIDGVGLPPAFKGIVKGAQIGKGLLRKKLKSASKSVADDITGPAQRLTKETPGASRSGVHPSTPVGHRGKPLNVIPGTNKPATIGGRKFTGHALDRMQGRGLTPSVIEDTIARGTQSTSRGARVFTTDQARVILNSAGDVITVYPK